MAVTGGRSSSSLPWVASIDMYRKVPGDLLEGSKEGRITSWIALSVMLWLFINETLAFLSTTIVPHLHLDSSKITKFQIDFNITMLDLRCDYATINVVSLLGNEQNITKDIKRWTVDGQGITKHLHNHPDDNNGKQREQLVLSDPNINQTVEEIGKHSVSLDQETLEYAMEEHNFLFVKFYADWCGHCRALAPTWEKFAEIMHDVEEKVLSHVGQDYTDEEYAKAKLLHLPVLIGQVDCVEHHSLCQEQLIRGYPTMVLYVNGERYKGGEYQGQRTVVDLIQFLENAELVSESQESDKIKNHTEMALAKHLNMTKAHSDWLDAMNRVRHHVDRMWDVQEHPGCHLEGRLEMNRAPGHFFIQAKSESHSIDPRNANLSHVIHHLAFQPLLEKQQAKAAKNVVFPDHFDQSKATAPLDGLVFALEQEHASWHHYLKLISTNTHHFQVLKSSQLSLYREDHVPEAKFVMDVSPIAISYSRRKRRWYDYITSIMAILGGTFTVVGLIESMVETTAKKITHRRKQPLRRPPPPTPPPPLPPPPRMGAGGGGNAAATSTMRRVHPHPPPAAP